MTSNNFKIPKNINCLAKADFNKLLNIKDYFLKSIASAFDSVIENFLKNEAVFYYNFGNPKYIEKMLKAEYARAIRYNTFFSVAIVDLDKFKQINDSAGHAAGDKALQQLAKTMRFNAQGQVIDFGVSAEQAMKAPRLHCSMGGRISLEVERFSPELVDYLEKKGYRLDLRESYSFYMGCIQAVLKCDNGKGFQGIADIRRDGTAKGY